MYTKLIYVYPRPSGCPMDLAAL